MAIINQPQPTVPMQPATISTSAVSKTNQAQNLDKINTANNAINKASNPSVVDYLSLNGQPSDYNSRANLAQNYGITNYTGTATQNTQLLNYLRSGTTSATGSKSGISGNLGTAKGNTAVLDNVTKKDNEANTVIHPDGGTTTTNKDGTYTIQDNAGQIYNIPFGFDPSLAKDNIDTINQFNQQAESSKQVLDQAKASLGNDPFAIYQIDDIKQKYDVLIQQMKDKNTMLMGSISKSSARGGMLQYANEMDSMYKNMEFDKATERIGDLVYQETSAITKAAAEYKAGNVKAFNDAIKEYETVLKDKQKAISDLHKQINDTYKQNAADLKTTQTQLRNEKLDSLKFSDAAASYVASQIEGVKDPAKIEQIYKDAADKYGISDVGFLKSAVIDQISKTKKEDLANQRMEALINKSNQPPTEKMITTAKLNYIKKNNPLIEADTTNTENEVNNYIKTAKLWKSAVNTDFSDKTNLGPKGYFTYDYGNKLINNLPEGINVVEFIKANRNKFDNHLNKYGLSKDQIDQINA